MTLIYIDVETTGLDPQKNSIVQLAGMIKKGDIEEKFNYRICPYHNEDMSDLATEKTGLTTAEVYNYPDQAEVFKEFKALCDKYVTSYTEKMYMVGYNVGFDDNFMRAWFEINGARWGYEVWFPYIDVMNLAALKMLGRRPSMPSFKLVDVYKKFMGKSFDNAHDAFADITATKELFEYLTMDLLLIPEKKKEEAAKVPVRTRKAKKTVPEMDPDEIPF